MILKLFNSLNRKKEVFKPIKPSNVGVYTCGPTVYDYVTIGNWRTYFLGDIVIRVLQYLGFETEYIMNITDVGHLTGDNLGDSSSGEDRQEKAALREHKSAWELADFYTQDFKEGYKQLNLIQPRLFCKATDHIKEQISLISQIEKKGFTYKTPDGIYFNVRNYKKAGNRYPSLSTLDKIREGARIAKNPYKKNPRDFALWKFSPPDQKRQMEWDSPWAPPGVRGKVKGFPGWHIECSAMGLKYLGNAYRGEQFHSEQSRTIDIHIGGEDLRSTHHPNEICQSEAATGIKPFVKYWLHGAFLLVNNGRMGKSLGNAYTLHDVIKKGFNPLALRYFFLNCHYRKQINFTWKNLEAAQIALEDLWKKAQVFGVNSRISASDKNPSIKVLKRWHEFENAIKNDLNLSEALAALYQGLNEVSTDFDLIYLLEKADKIFGLKLIEIGRQSYNKLEKATQGMQKLLLKREELRKTGKWEEADQIRKAIEQKGYSIQDTSKGSQVIMRKKC